MTVAPNWATSAANNDSRPSAHATTQADTVIFSLKISAIKHSQNYAMGQIL
jgi:hypothetical protein